MKKLLVLSLVGLTVLTTAFAARMKVTIEGSTTVLPIAQASAESFMNYNKGVDISVRGGGSGVGIASLLEGTCDIADASRAIKSKEIKRAKEKGINPVAHVVAMDGIAVIIHPKNKKINALTREQIQDIYTGKISNWSEVGGKKKKIVVVSRDSASGTFEAFNKLALKKEKVRPDALLNASNRAVITTVSKTKGAIGYVGLGYVNSSVKPVTVNGIECTKSTVLSGAYPLSRPLYMYTNGEPKGVTKKFIDFVLGSQGQKLAEEAGFVSLK